MTESQIGAEQPGVIINLRMQIFLPCNKTKVGGDSLEEVVALWLD